ncbi:MAG: DUF309 domain-containing protein [Blastocatellia bacterium]|nr:DUF309 domain-containing protein [Blastocatellia bacterium]
MSSRKMNAAAEYSEGIALFNEGRYFECHEVWETIWLRAEGAEREFLHAMIQIAAALHHRERGNAKGAASVHARAQARLAALPATMMGLDARAFADAVKAHFDGAATRPRIALQDRL